MTLLYIAAGLAAVVALLSIPLLVQLIRRRFVLSLGASLLIISTALLTKAALSAFACGLALNSFAFACIEITSNLYLLHHIPRQQLRRFEPARIFACAIPLTFGPWFGVYLQQRVAFAAPFAVAAVSAMLPLVLSWCLRFTELSPSCRKPPKPLRYLPRFFAQLRLRLAWGLAGGVLAQPGGVSSTSTRPSLRWCPGSVLRRGAPLHRSAPPGSSWCRCGAGLAGATGFGRYWPPGMGLQV